MTLLIGSTARLVHLDACVEVRGNRYSVPADLCGRMVTVRISLDGNISIYDDNVLVAQHRLQRTADGWVTVPAHHAIL